MGKAFKWLLETVARAFIGIFVNWLWTVWGAVIVSGLIALYSHAYLLPIVWFDRAIGASFAFLVIAVFGTLGRFAKTELASAHKSNLVVECGRVKEVCLDNEGRWTHSTLVDSDFRTAFVAEFSNRAHPKHRVEKANDVRAKVTINAGPANNQRVRVNPAPWLNARSPSVSFESGVAHELLLAVLDHDVDRETANVRIVFFGMRDHREHSENTRRYELTGSLTGLAVATVTLTVDGILKGPFFFHLNPGDPGNVPPKCEPFFPPGNFGRLIAKLPFWTRRTDG